MLGSARPTEAVDRAGGIHCSRLCLQICAGCLGSPPTVTRSHAWCATTGGRVARAILFRRKFSERHRNYDPRPRWLVPPGADRYDINLR